MPVAEVEVSCADVLLHGELAVPETSSGLVLLAVGRAGTRRRDEAVARSLHLHGWATLLFGLLPRTDPSVDPFAPVETSTLAARLVCALDGLTGRATTARLPVVLLGFGDDADVVLAAAAARPDQVESVVLLGSGAGLDAPLEWVRAPVLLALAADDELGPAEREELGRRLRVPFHVVSIDSPDPRLFDPDARERAVGVVTGALRHPSVLHPTPAGGTATTSAASDRPLAADQLRLARPSPVGSPPRGAA